MITKHVGGVGAVIVNKNNQFLILQKNVHPPFWEFLKGTPKPNEPYAKLLQREIKEETGITDYAIVDGFKHSIQYDFQAPDAHIFRTVDYVLVKTDQEPVISDEHLDYKWVTLKEAEKFFQNENFRDLARRASEFLNKHV